MLFFANKHKRNKNNKVQDPRSIRAEDIDWNNAQEIGHGSFGVVLKAKWNSSDVAVKKLHEKNLTAEQRTEFMREASYVFKCYLKC